MRLSVNLQQNPEAANQRYEAVEPHMGTLVQVIVYTTDEQQAKAAFRVAFDRIRDLDRTLSDYRPDSELNEITRTAVGRAVRVSSDLFAVLDASQRLAAQTDGAFDITQGPLIKLWREARRGRRLPDPNALRAAGARGGFRKLHLDAIHRTVTLDANGMNLDVGAIGKGYAASEAIEALRGIGVRSALAGVSGDVAFSEAPPGQRGWRIDIHSLDPAVTRLPRVLELTNAAVSTSGNSEQHVDIDGRRYSHIIEPASAQALVDDVTVTVIARHGIDADGLDTAVSVLGLQRGLELIEVHREAAALIVQRTKAGITATASSRFSALVQEMRRKPAGD